MRIRHISLLYFGSFLLVATIFCFCRPAFAQKQEYADILSSMEEIEDIQGNIALKEKSLAGYAGVLSQDPYTLRGLEKTQLKKAHAIQAELAELRKALEKSKTRNAAALKAFRKATAQIDQLRKEALEMLDKIKRAGKHPGNTKRAIRAIERDLSTLEGNNLIDIVRWLDNVQQIIAGGRPIEWIAAADLNTDQMNENPVLKAIATPYVEIMRDVIKMPLPERIKKLDEYMGTAEKVIALIKSLAGKSESALGNAAMESLINSLDLLDEMMPDNIYPLKSFIQFSKVLVEGIYKTYENLHYELSRKNLLMLFELSQSDSENSKVALYPKALFGRIEDAGYDLNGTWSGIEFRDGPLQLSIRHYGDSVVATLLTGNRYIPAGQISWKGTMSSNPFAAKGHVAFKGFKKPYWVDIQVRVIDNDQIITTWPSKLDPPGNITFRRVK